MKFISTTFVLFIYLSSNYILANEPEHNDKEHEKAENNLDNEHWEKAHGSGVPDKPERKPGSENKTTEK